jgi:hypothetical protein
VIRDSSSDERVEHFTTTIAVNAGRLSFSHRPSRLAS